MGGGGMGRGSPAFREQFIEARLKPIRRRQRVMAGEGRANWLCFVIFV